MVNKMVNYFRPWNSYKTVEIDHVILHCFLSLFILVTPDLTSLNYDDDLNELGKDDLTN